MIEETYKNKAREILSDYITENRLRKTPERFSVLDVVLNAEGHNSADQLLALMPPEFHVSRMTVYSALKLFEELGLVTGHEINGVTLYERSIGNKPHHHCVCRGCGKMWDYQDDNIDAAVRNARTPRFRRSYHTLYLYGLCNACQARLARLRKRLAQERATSMTREEIRFARISQELEEAAQWVK